MKHDLPLIGPNIHSTLRKLVHVWFYAGLLWSDDQHHCALGSRDVLIIAQTENLQGPNVIPRHRADLAAPDISELERLQGYDDASIMAAKYVLEDRFSEVKVERSKHKKPLKKNHILNIITTLLKHSQKDGSKCYILY